MGDAVAPGTVVLDRLAYPHQEQGAAPNKTLIAHRRTQSLLCNRAESS